MFNIKKPVRKAEGSFYIERINTKTGKRFISAPQKNLLTDIFSKAISVSENSYAHAEVFWKLHIGDGTTEPAAGDTAIANKKWEVVISDSKASISENMLNVSITAKFVLPASSSYVGNITEVGLYGSIGLVTHSLLKDAEGNPYTIEKTDLDQITFIYTITMTLPEPGKIFIDPMRRINGAYISGNTYEDFCTLSYLESSGNRAFGILTPLKNVMWKGKLISRFKRSYISAYRSDSATAEFPFSYPTAYHSGNCTYDESNKTITIPRRRIVAEGYLNGHYINGVCPFGHVQQIGTIMLYFPNEEVMPKAELKGYSIGNGDGTTKEFAPSLQYWIKDTEKVYVDGVLKTRGTDYTCDNMHNSTNLFELIPSSHMMIIEGAASGSDWMNYSNDMKLGSLTRACLSEMYDPSDIGLVEGSVIKINQFGDSIFYMFGEEDLSLDQTVTEIYLTTTKNASYNKFSISYSNDGDTYTSLLTDITPDQKNMGNSNLSDLTKHTVTAVKAKYWKLSITNSNSQLPVGDVGIVMRKTGAKMKFTTAPASGAVITMDATIDRPYKDDKHVVDIVGTVQM